MDINPHLSNWVILDPTRRSAGDATNRSGPRCSARNGSSNTPGASPRHKRSRSAIVNRRRHGSAGRGVNLWVTRDFLSCRHYRVRAFTDADLRKIATR